MLSSSIGFYSHSKTQKLCNGLILRAFLAFNKRLNNLEPLILKLTFGM